MHKPMNLWISNTHVFLLAVLDVKDVHTLGILDLLRWRPLEVDKLVNDLL